MQRQAEGEKPGESKPEAELALKQHRALVSTLLAKMNISGQLSEGVLPGTTMKKKRVPNIEVSRNRRPVSHHSAGSQTRQKSTKINLAKEPEEQKARPSAGRSLPPQKGANEPREPLP